MDKIIELVKQQGIEHIVVVCAVAILTTVHLGKFIWREIWPADETKRAKAFLDALLKQMGLKKEELLTLMRSKGPESQPKELAREFLETLLGDNQHAKEELVRILRIGAIYHSPAPKLRNYREFCQTLLQKFITIGDFTVGIEGRMFLQQKAFLDAISASLVPQTKVAFASCLCSHFISERKKDPELLEVLGIVGIKRGSPWLAIEVAKELHLPLALHRGEARVNAGYAKPNDFFDGTLPSHGKVMIVDDSITGGTMVLSAIDHLKALHLGVEFCLVLFEVLGKPGRENLKDNGVRLLAICTFDGRTNELANAC